MDSISIINNTFQSNFILFSDITSMNNDNFNFTITNLTLEGNTFNETYPVGSNIPQYYFIGFKSIGGKNEVGYLMFGFVD